MALNTRKNILICIPSYTHGGAEIHSLYTAKALQKREGVKVFFLAFGRVDTFQSKLIEEGFETIYFNLPDFLRLSNYKKIIILFQLIILLRKFKFSTVFAGTEQCNLLMGLVWRFVGAKKFFWHQWGIDNRTSFGFWEKLVINFKPTYIANSSVCSQNIAKRHQLDVSTIKVIHNTFNEKLLEVKSTNQTDELKIVMVANFFEEKDHVTVIESIRLFVNKHLDSKIKVYFVGRSNGGRLMKNAKALAFDLNLNKYVEFLGLVEDVADFLSKMDVGLLSTKSEGLSNSLLEYMAVGLPVIATDIAQNREALGPGNKFFEVGNSQKLVNLLEEFYFGRDTLKVIGTSNREYVKQHFSNEKYNQTILNLIDNE
jgi:glycosyltransferase involved in cell wall biosynthesis